MHILFAAILLSLIDTIDDVVAYMPDFDERVLTGMGVFAAIVDAGSFVAAGRHLGLSQPAVSRAVARLEARLDIRLFNRTTRVVSLTDDGMRFPAEVRPLMAALEEAAPKSSLPRLFTTLRQDIEPMQSCRNSETTRTFQWL